MSLQLLRPSYNLQHIQSLSSLAASLGLSEAELAGLIHLAPTLYRQGSKPKEGGGVRVYYDAYEPLKTVHGRLLHQVLNRVTWPPYLFGGVRDPENPRDYIGNVRVHFATALQFKTDVASFFPSIKAELVLGIWQDFFRFSRPVAEALTALTTYQGFLPQGTRTAQALANLVLWDVEAEAFSKLASLGFRYTRLTDDITISSSDPRDVQHLNQAIPLIHLMLRSRGFRRKGKKERISTQRGQMIVNNVLTNQKPALPGKKRNEIARETITLAKRVRDAGYSAADESVLRSVIGRLNTLARFHRLGSLLYGVLPRATAKSAGLSRWAVL
jgi:hypothetical protein